MLLIKRRAAKLSSRVNSAKFPSQSSLGSSALPTTASRSGIGLNRKNNVAGGVSELLLPAAIGLLSRLSNPLNVTLLSSQLLENDVLYPQPVDLVRSRQIFSAFYTAALRFAEDKRNEAQEHMRSNLSGPEWTKAVIQGAGENSPRWRHVLMIGGLLLSQHSPPDESLAISLQPKLEGALVTASNLSLAQTHPSPNSQLSVAFVLNHTFPLLSPPSQAQLNYDLLLPVLVEAAFFSRDGLEHGYWLGTIDQDVRQVKGQFFNWSPRSKSFARIKEIKSRPLMSTLGSLSKLIAHSITCVQDERAILRSMGRIAEFARNLGLSWRQNKLSEVDTMEEAQYLDQETINLTLPFLLQILRDTMFATVITLRAVLGRLLCDKALASDVNAPVLAMQSLHILRDMYFIAHRFGQTSSSQYVFISFTSLDILNQHPTQAEGFLAQIKPAERGHIPAHPLDRILDLFFLNTAEHLTLSVNAEMNGELLSAALPYIQAQADPRLGQVSEAGHSVVLAVFAAPQNADIVPHYIPLYVETLLRSFPQILNTRQFRLAIRSVVRLAAPPSSVATSMPLMQAVVLNLLSQRFSYANEEIIPHNSDDPVEETQQHSERSALLLSVIDCLSLLPVPLLEDWLPVSADLLHKIENLEQRNLCQKRFWEVLSNGDMDFKRAAACVAWYNRRGGRELILFGELPEEDDFTMSGGLQHDSKL